MVRLRKLLFPCPLEQKPCLAGTECVSEQGKDLCSTAGGQCVIERDGYYTTTGICLALGLFFILAYYPTHRPQAARSVFRVQCSSRSLTSSSSRSSSFDEVACSYLMRPVEVATPLLASGIHQKPIVTGSLRMAVQIAHGFTSVTCSWVVSQNCMLTSCYWGSSKFILEIYTRSWSLIRD
ncbi:hypothetical protein H4582DRAFT_1064440 [Lactarius indigo]|nr:hypothetical protein H4582DRAFT_1064440 [Lactarius indigo]